MSSGKMDGAGAMGLYLYCIANTGEQVSLEGTGIEGREVYTVPYRGISAVVHDCEAVPYVSDGQGSLRAWTLSHHATVERAWETWGVVLPFSFNTVIKVEEGTDSSHGIRRWLEENHQKLKLKLAAVTGKAEFGVQLFREPGDMAESVAGTSPELRALEEDVRSKPPGLAYMYRQRLERLLKKEMEAGADRFCQECFGRIRVLADEVRVDKVKASEAEAQMIMNLSCLVSRDRYKDLGDELDRITKTRGFSVRFTGPWPPYSFMD